MPHPFDKLKYDPASEGWTGTIKLASLRDCYGKWYVSWDEIDGPYPDPRKPRERGVGALTVLDPTQQGISEQQRAAIDFLLGDEDAVTESLLAFFLKQAQAMYYSQSLPSLDTCDPEFTEVRQRFDTVAGIRELIQFRGLTVTRKHRTGYAHTVFSLTSPLDDEHGFTVAVHKDKPRRWAGLGELGGL